MSELILHSYRRCPFAIRVRMVLEEKGLPYRVIEEKLSDLSAELLLLHPEGRVPLLKHGDQVIYESAIITEYLEEAFPARPLMPADPAARAQTRLWTYWCNQIFKPDLDAYKYEWKNLDEAGRAELSERLRSHLAQMEAPLKAQEFFMGSALSLADIHLFPFYRQLTRCTPELAMLTEFPLLSAWLERMTSRPSYERAMKLPGT